MKRTGAFTLAELLVALAITSILVLLLANLGSATLTAWQQGRNRLDTFSNARQVMSRIGDEISGAVAAKDRIEFVENVSELDSGSNAPVPKTSENVFLVAPYPNSGAGDLCVIAYRHDTVNHRLERRFKDSASAWNVAVAQRYKVSGYPDSTPTEWRTVAGGVMEFEIRCYSQADLDADKDATASWSSRTIGNTTMEGKTPRRVVLRLKVVDDKSLVRLASMTPNTIPYDALLKRAVREFFADFSLPAR